MRLQSRKNHACDYLSQMLQTVRDASMIPTLLLMDGSLPRPHAKNRQIAPERMATLIVGLGGTLRAGSSTENTLSHVLQHARAFGAETLLFSGQMLNLPIYVPGADARCDRARALLAALRRADAIVVASPGYHGGISGLVKNALDYTEDMSQDALPYFEGRAVGCVATGAGWQGANATLNALRNVAHALRGWPTPLGIALNTLEPLFDSAGECLLPSVSDCARLMAQQLVDFASRRARS